MLKLLLNWILKAATFNLFLSPTPIGRRLGGHDIPGVTDSYIVLTITIANQIVFSGHFQTT
jgi:hypothetical protein